MDTNVILIICNLIPVLIILSYVVEGWSKGALYMLVSLVRLFGSYYIARILSDLSVHTLMGIPAIRSFVSSIAAQHQDLLKSLPGALNLFMGNTVNVTIDMMTNWILYAVSFIVIFIVVMIFFSVILRMSKMFNKIPVLGLINRLLGTLEGLIFGTGLTLLVIYIVAFLLRIVGEDTLSNLLMSTWLPVLFRTYF